jgi:hypothetical protein
VSRHSPEHAQRAGGSVFFQPSFRAFSAGRIHTARVSTRGTVRSERLSPSGPPIESSQARSTIRLIIDSDADDFRDARGGQSVTLQLDGFAWETLAEQSAQMGVSVEELATHAIMYYVADLDSGRIARRIPAA